MTLDRQAFEIDGARVEMIRVPVRRHDWDYRQQRAGEPWGHPREQALYEIWIDGEHVGLAHRKHGFGRQHWNIDRLCPQYGHVAGMGDETVTARGWVDSSKRLWDLEAAAGAAVRLRQEKTHHGKPPKLATETEITAWVKLHRGQKAEEARLLEARHEQWKREEAAKKRASEEARLDTLGGLQSIDGRLGGQLTNYEASALRIAIAAYTRSSG
jgi:hypothetical protein